MNCERVRNLISAYVDGELETDECRQMRAHFVACEVCNAELLAEQRAKELLSNLPSLEVPEDFSLALAARLGEADSELQLGMWLVPHLAPAAVAAAILLVVSVSVLRGLPEKHVIEAGSLYRQHTLVTAAQPLAEPALTNYYYAAAADGAANGRTPVTADRVKLVGQSFGE